MESLHRNVLHDHIVLVPEVGFTSSAIAFPCLRLLGFRLPRFASRPRFIAMCDLVWIFDGAPPIMLYSCCFNPHNSSSKYVKVVGLQLLYNVGKNNSVEH